MPLLHIGRSIIPSVVSLENATPFDPVTGECVDINGCRTVFGILWSCLSVIFICTWVAIHPNIPKVGVHPAVVFYQDLEMMLIALLVPEFMILWAMRQRASAKAVGRKFKSRWNFHLLSVCIGTLKRTFRVWMEHDPWIFRTDGRLRSLRR
jgi:hypothetical protein